MTPNESPKNTLLLRLSVAVLVVALLAFLWTIGAYVAVFSGELSGDHSRWGQFGDYLGGVLNPIFGLLALVALLYTIHLQSRELSNSTRELANSVRVLDEQSESLKRQNFERTFFEMVRLHHDIIRDMDLVSAYSEGIGNRRVEGRDCFRWLFDNFRMRYREVAASEQPHDNLVELAYAGFSERYQQEVGHYFRNYYRILKFIKDNSPGDPKRYTGILRAQMSSFELILLFYNALCADNVKLKRLVEEYAMLKNLDPALVINRRYEVGLFEPGAFGDRHQTIAGHDGEEQAASENSRS